MDRSQHRGRYKEGNTRPDGDYEVGKNRPPKASQFASGDGRKRGRRPKGQKNFDTEFMEEAARMVEITENGKKRKVSKLRTSIIRALHNSAVAGKNPAIGIVFNTSRQIADKAVPISSDLTRNQDEMLSAWLEQKLGQQLIGDNPGDPEALIDDDDDNDDTAIADEGSRDD